MLLLPLNPFHSDDLARIESKWLENNDVSLPLQVKMNDFLLLPHDTYYTLFQSKVTPVA